MCYWWQDGVVCLCYITINLDLSSSSPTSSTTAALKINIFVFLNLSLLWFEEKMNEKRKSKHWKQDTMFIWHPCSVVWMLWTLKRRTNDVLCILSAQLTFTLNYHSLEDHITLSECREPLKDVQTTYCMFILYMSYVCCVHVLNVHPN